MPTRKSSAVWEGSLKTGKGTYKVGSGAVGGAYNFGSRFEDEPGSNPEELLAAAGSVVRLWIAWTRFRADRPALRRVSGLSQGSYLLKGVTGKSFGRARGGESGHWGESSVARDMADSIR